MSSFPGLPIARPGATGKELYEAYYALSLHVPRARMQRAAEIMAALTMAFSREPLSKEFFDAVALVEHDAAAMAFNVNAKREAERVKAERGYK